MAKKAASKQEGPAKGSDRELKELVMTIIDLLVDRDPYQVRRVLATVETFFPSKLIVKSSEVTIP